MALGKVSYQFLVLTIIYTGTSADPIQHPNGIPRELLTNPAEINDLFYDPNGTNDLKDVAPVTKYQSEFNLQQTIKDVEELITTNPELPRLTRGEIIDIIENITKTDAQNLREKMRFDQKYNRVNGQRAVMLVMPFSVGSANGGDIKELYTRTPITRIVGDKTVPPEKKSVRKPTRKRINLPNQNVHDDKTEHKVRGTGRDVFEITTFRPSTVLPITTKNVYDVNYGKTLKKYSNPEVESFTNKFSDTTTKYDEQHKYVVSDQGERNSTIKYESTSKKYNGDITRSSTTRPLPSTTLKYVDFLPLKTTKTIPSFKLLPTKSKPKRTKVTQKYSNHKYVDETKPDDVHSSGIHIINPPILNPKVTSPSSESNDTVSKDTTSSSGQNLEQTQVNKKGIYISQFGDAGTDITDSLGMPDEMKSVVKEFDFQFKPSTSGINDEPVKIELGTEQFDEKPVKHEAFPGATTELPDLTDVVENLSPDMKDLLTNFGLIGNPVTSTLSPSTDTIHVVQNAEIKPEAYTRFKPIPGNVHIDDDMDRFLSRFGLTDNSRSQKSINMGKLEKHAEKSAHVVYAVPANSTYAMNELPGTQTNHVFNPTSSNTTEEELNKLGKLLDMIRQFDKMNVNVTDESLKSIDTKTLDELVFSLNSQLNASGGSFDVKHQKRQEEEARVTGTSTAEPSNEQNVQGSGDVAGGASFSNEMSKNPEFGDLADSFGGEISTSTMTVPVITPKTGFYFLFDWNTFLDIDNQEGKRVNLRFQPYVGDARQFLSVTVP